MTRSRLRRTAAIVFWPVLLLVVWGELAPHPPHIELETSDKLLHFLAYFGLAAILAAALGSGRALVYAVAGLVALGGALEIVQGFVGRDAEWLDEAANTLGAVAGAILGLVALRLLRPRD